MKSEKLYKWIIFILLILNLIQVGAFLLAPKPHKPHNNNFRTEAFKILNLDNKQQIQFKNFAKEHRSQMLSLIDQQKALTSDYFENPNDSILVLITNVEANKIKVTEENFKQIESILNEDQKQKFTVFKEKAIQVIIK